VGTITARRAAEKRNQAAKEKKKLETKDVLIWLGGYFAKPIILPPDGEWYAPLGR
jgi:hypothetical protein